MTALAVPMRLGLVVSLTAALVGLAIALTGAGWHDPTAAHDWAEALIDIRPQAVGERLMLAYPELPSLSLAAIAKGLGGDIAVPTLLGALLVALAATGHAVRLSQNPRVGGWRLPLIMLGVTQPLLLWAATAGGGRAWALALAVPLGRTILRFAREGDVQSQVSVALALALAITADARLILLAAALVPGLLVLARPSAILGSAAGYLLVLLWPATALAGSVAYLNLIFGTGIGGWLGRIGTAAMAGRVGPGTASPWQDSDLGPLVAATLVMALATAPVLAGALIRLRRQRLVSTPLFVLAISPPLATLIAWSLGALDHPASFLCLLIGPGWMATELLVQRGRPAFATLLVAAGWLGGGAVLAWSPTAAMAAWTDAWVRPAAADRIGLDDHTAGLRFGQALAGLDQIMIDDATAAPVIAARGSADGLILPDDTAFILAEIGRDRTPAALAVPDPDSALGKRDQLNRRWPQLWRDGLPGYWLALQIGPWRLWRRDGDPS